MNMRDDVLKNGAKLSIYQGDNSWIETNGVEVNLVLTPRIGSRSIGITSAVHQPGQGFEPHLHPISEEVLICIKGKGEFYLKDKWIPVSEGDIVFAPPGVLHGTRNPAGNTEIFVTVGCGAPPQLDLYQRSNYNPLADDQETQAGTK